ncbi:MAG TPA: hypothetical protein VKC53_03250 [Patescibacteria group bacterium]|nr:hypothetical protein [Patescibacteria group bacterium]
MKKSNKYNGFIAMWLVNMVLLVLANMYWPRNFVLGSMTVSKWTAVVGVALLWNAALWATQPVADKLKVKLNSPMKMMLAYLAANFVALWVLARLGPGVGFGVSSSVLVFGLAFVANFVQYLVWALLAKLKLAEM